MRANAATKDSIRHDEIQRLHNELTMPVGEFGALAAAVLMALSVMFVTHPLSKPERVHTTALSRDARIQARDKSRRMSAKVHEEEFGVSGADAPTGSFVATGDAHSGRHS